MPQVPLNVNEMDTQVDFWEEVSCKQWSIYGYVAMVKMQCPINSRASEDCEAQRRPPLQKATVDLDAAQILLKTHSGDLEESRKAEAIAEQLQAPYVVIITCPDS